MNLEIGLHSAPSTIDTNLTTLTPHLFGFIAAEESATLVSGLRMGTSGHTLTERRE
jgi:hypothetical protein